jgi:hypothetical protein
MNRAPMHLRVSSFTYLQNICNTVVAAGNSYLDFHGLSGRLCRCRGQTGRGMSHESRKHDVSARRGSCVLRGADILTLRKCRAERRTGRYYLQLLRRPNSLASLPRKGTPQSRLHSCDQKAKPNCYQTISRTRPTVHLIQYVRAYNWKTI